MPVNTSTSARATVEVEDGIVNSPATHSVATACWKLNRGNKILALVALVAMSVALGLALSSRENKTDRDLIPSQVIGGSVAGSYRYSYAVSLQHRYGHLCGGSLITRDIVLTAAHCWKGFFDPFTGGVVPSLKAVAGRHDLNDVHNGESIPILGSISHPNYNATTMDNDFMLVFLETGFTAGNVGLVKLNPDVSLPSEGQDLTTIGWGDADVRVCREQFIPQQLKLKHLNLKAFSNEHCDAAGGYYNGTFVTLEGGITDTMLCAFANPDESSCSGDSGGPLVIKGADAASDLQVGVVSFVLGECASDFPVVYSRVSGAYDWIQSEVCAYNSNTANEAGFVCPLVSTWSPTASPITTVAPTFAPSMQCDADTPCAEGMCCSQWGVSLHVHYSLNH
jgi:trypsin